MGLFTLEILSLVQLVNFYSDALHFASIVFWSLLQWETKRAEASSV